MADYVILLGAEDVQQASFAIRDAADRMSQAADSIEDSLHRQRLFMDDWLMRLENLSNNTPKETQDG